MLEQMNLNDLGSVEFCMRHNPGNLSGETYEGCSK